MVRDEGGADYVVFSLWWCGCGGVGSGIFGFFFCLLIREVGYGVLVFWGRRFGRVVTLACAVYACNSYWLGFN
jgi:hypothetical protein